MGRIVLLASVLVALVVGEAVAGPLPGARAPERGPGPRHEPVLRVGGVQLDIEALRGEALARLKEGVAEAIEARSDELRTAFGAEADAWAQTLYKDFLYWLNERARAELLRRHPHLREAALPEERFVEWLGAPDRELRLYVDLYFAERAPALKWPLDAWSDEASWELAEGLKELLADARDKLARFTRTAEDAAREPDAPLADMLRRHELSGEWMDGFEAHEDRLRALDGRYRVVDATRLVVEAFSCFFFAAPPVDGVAAEQDGQPLWNRFVRDPAGDATDRAGATWWYSRWERADGRWRQRDTRDVAVEVLSRTPAVQPR